MPQGLNGLPASPDVLKAARNSQRSGNPIPVIQSFSPETASTQDLEAAFMGTEGNQS